MYLLLFTNLMLLFYNVVLLFWKHLYLVLLFTNSVDDTILSKKEYDRF